MARILNVKGEVAFFENSKSLWLRGRYIWVLVPGKCLGAWRSSWGTCWAGADLQLWFQRFTQPYGVGTFFSGGGSGVCLRSLWRGSVSHRFRQQAENFLRLAKETDSPRLRWVLVEMAQLC